MNNLDHALAYLKRGFSVFPVHHPSMPREGLGLEREPLSDRDVGKRPLVKWQAYQERLPRESEVRAWWKKYPAANIGIATGVVSGCFVVDADGPEAVNWVAEKFGGLPETLTVFTQKGQHFYFAHPGFEVRSGARVVKVGSGQVDVRGDGGYGVLPPSTHFSGFVYDWADPDAVLMPAPDWLLQMMQERGERAGHLPKHQLDELLKGVGEGGRHDAVIRLAGHWIGLGLRLDEVNALCLAWNKANNPPSPDDHITSRVKNLWEEHYRKRRHNPDGPEMVREGDDFTFTWPQYGIQIELRYLREVSDGLQGEITVLNQNTGRIAHWSRLKLASLSQREDLTKRLSRTKDGSNTNWAEILQQLGRMATNEYRIGSPIVELVPSKAPVTREFIAKLMPEHEVTVMFGDGGVGKSTVALVLAVAVASGQGLPNGLRPIERSPVLYLDWESCVEEHADRLMAILNGMGLSPKDVEGMLHYRAMARSLPDEIVAIKAEVSRLGVGLVIVDSYVMAAGAEPEKSDAAQRVMNALRELSPATKLIITHVNKADAQDGNGRARAYGSVFVQNLPRSVWLLKRSEADTDLVVGFYHKKVNRGRLRQPFGFRISYLNAAGTPAKDGEGTDAIRITAEDVSRHQELRKGGSYRFAIRGVLKDGSRGLEEIAAEVDGSKETIRRTLYRMRDDGEVGFGSGQWYLRAEQAEDL